MKSSMLFPIRHFSKFIDNITLRVKSGTGGNGAGTFARDNFNPRGKPDGGNGGDGGDIFVLSDESESSYNYLKKFYQAENGQAGQKGGSNGCCGKDETIHVPVGTSIYNLNKDDGSRKHIVSLSKPKVSFLLAKGGRGGQGNRAMRTNNHTYEKGHTGDELVVELDLKTISDVGLVGMPNAGKSTFLSKFTGSRPKIAAYPFTTLHPNIGYTNYDREVQRSIADIPGLIEGAHLNCGLGHSFLKHITQCNFLLLMVDGSRPDPVADSRVIFQELEYFRAGLAKNVVAIIVSKVDRLQDSRALLERFKQNWPETEVLGYSAKSNEGQENVQSLLNKFQTRP